MQREDVFVSPDWLAERLDRPDVLPVDASWYLPTMLRDGVPRNGAAEYAQAHIPGAVFFDLDAHSDPSSGLPHMMPGPVQFASAMRRLGISNSHTLVIHDGLGLFSAPRVWWTFRAMGAREVYLLDGGLPAWVEAGHPLTDEPVRRTASHFVAQLDTSVIADLAAVEAAVDAGAATVIDARPADRFEGRTPEPRPGLRSGHMPGARNVPFTELLEDGRMKSVEALKALFAARGVPLDGPIITSCGSGVSAVTLTLALKLAGARDVRVYDGSWAQWGGIERLPVATGPDGA